MPEDRTFMIEDARLIFRNFAGKESQYNRKGDRNFGVIIPPEEVDTLTEQGWRIRVLDPRDEGDEPTFWVKVSIGYKVRPPRVVLLTSGSRTQLAENQLEVIDWADIKTADLVCRAYDWTVGDKTGTAAYLQSLFVTINEDPLEAKYRIYEDPPAAHEDDD